MGEFEKLVLLSVASGKGEACGSMKTGRIVVLSAGLVALSIRTCSML